MFINSRFKREHSKLRLLHSFAFLGWSSFDGPMFVCFTGTNTRDPEYIRIYKSFHSYTNVIVLLSISRWLANTVDRLILRHLITTRHFTPWVVDGIHNQRVNHVAGSATHWSNTGHGVVSKQARHMGGRHMGGAWRDASVPVQSAAI